MRIDHYAYQRATRVASFGLLLQLAVGITLLLFGISFRDTAFQFAASYVLSGLVVWVGLIIIFHQHKLERLESLEEDELAASRGGSLSGSFFDVAASESSVAARRLALMHKWLMPALSLLLALMLAGSATMMLRFMSGLKSGVHEYGRTESLGWAVAICLSFAVASFIFSRFIAGMSKQSVWQNLRGGASYMVGNALVLAAVGAGIIFRFFQNDAVVEAMGWAIPVFQLVVAAEILLNFVLNLYRPRIPGEVPRPAFDSKLLSLFATPDSIVRTLNEAVNYQFGFDVTSSWGYQLLLQSFAWLLAIGMVALGLLNTMVVVEPHQQAVKLRGGALANSTVYGSGIMWKRPWPFETAAVYDVTRIRTLNLTAQQRVRKPIELWTDEIENSADLPIEPFIVGSSVTHTGDQASPEKTAVPAAATTQPAEEDRDPESARVSSYYAQIIAQITLRYHIKADQNGLLDYLNFLADSYDRASRLTDRERAMKDIALAQVTSRLSRLSLDEALSPGLTDLASDLRTSIQNALDAPEVKAGVEVVAVDIPLLRPMDSAAVSFEELAVSRQASRQVIVYMERNASATYADWIGDDSLAPRTIDALEQLDRLEQVTPRDEAAIAAQRLAIEQLLRRGGGHAARLIDEAERDRWVTLMTARTKASELANQLPQWKAARELYKQRRVMEIFSATLPHLHKFILGIDPSRVNVQMDLQQTNNILDFNSTINKETK